MSRKKNDDDDYFFQALKNMGLEINDVLPETSESSSVGQEVYKFLKLRSVLSEESPTERRKRLFVVPGGLNVFSR